MIFNKSKKKLFLWLMNGPWKGTFRYHFAKLAGINIPDSPRFIFIQKSVVFDAIHPELITIDDHVHITEGCILLTHFIDTTKSGINWKYGEIHVKTGSFLGANTIITKPCTIGKNAIVGAGSVVTKDIPDNEIWGGNPAKFIKKRENDTITRRR